LICFIIAVAEHGERVKVLMYCRAL